jgi:hypothetical protein
MQLTSSQQSSPWRTGKKRKTRNSSARITDSSAKIRTKRLPNVALEPYRHAKSLGTVLEGRSIWMFNVVGVGFLNNEMQNWLHQSQGTEEILPAASSVS